MTSRSTLLATLCFALLAAAVPATAPAAQGGNRHRLSLQARPDPVQAGDPVLITGRLTGPDSGHRRVVLWHRVDPARRFTRIQVVTTDADGFFFMTRRAGVVTTNRNWYVRAAGVRSRTVHERVHAIVSLSESVAQANTNQRVRFTGKVTPARARQVVVLQRQVGDSGEDFRDVRGARARTGRRGHFTITRRLRVPGSYTYRVRVVGSRRNAADASNTVDLQVQQRQNPRFTLAASTSPITVGSPVTLSGTVAGTQGAGATVTLYGRGNRGKYAAIATTKTGPDGSYSFTRAPAHTTVYQARAAGGRSAQLWVPVRDAVTAQADTTAPAAGQAVTFSGTVTPDKSGHPIELQRKGVDGDWHTAQIVDVGPGSTYVVRHVVQSPGTKLFRVRINGGPVNWGAASGPITVTVAPPAG